MSPFVLAPTAVAVGAFVVSALYVHHRGKVKHRFTRQPSDHSTVLAPYNALMYLFSAVPAEPYIDVNQFPELSARSRTASSPQSIAS